MNNIANNIKKLQKYYNLIISTRNSQLFNKYRNLLLFLSIPLGLYLEIYYLTIPLLIIPYYIFYCIFGVKSKLERYFIKKLRDEYKFLEMIYGREHLNAYIEKNINYKNLEGVNNFIKHP